MDSFRAFIMDVLDPIGVLLGIGIAIPIVWTWIEVVWGTRRRRRRAFEDARKNPGRRPGMLILDLLQGKDVKVAVEIFRQQTQELKAVPDSRVFRIERTSRIRPQDMLLLMQEIRGSAGKIAAEGIDVIHYFHAGPAVLASLVGAEFKNSCRVLLYQHQADGYVLFGPLQQDE